VLPVFGFLLAVRRRSKPFPDLDEVLTWQREIEPPQYAEVEVRSRYDRLLKEFICIEDLLHGFHH
jgi:hypothetical protein